MLRAHVQSFLQTLIWCVCLLDFLVFDIPKSMFVNKCWNDPNVCVSRLLWFLMKIEILNKSFKFIKKLYITFLLIMKFNTVFRNLDQIYF